MLRYGCTVHMFLFSIHLVNTHTFSCTCHFLIPETNHNLLTMLIVLYWIFLLMYINTFDQFDRGSFCVSRYEHACHSDYLIHSMAQLFFYSLTPIIFCSLTHLLFSSLTDLLFCSHTLLFTHSHTLFLLTHVLFCSLTNFYSLTHVLF